MNSSSRTRPFAEVIFRASETHFVLKITTFRAPAIYPDFTEYCACHEKWQSDITKYCACHQKWHSWLMSVTYEKSFTMRGATSITLQPHQILRLPRKKNLIFDPRHIWNVIYNARSNKHHPPTSPNAAPATKNDAHHWLSWHMQRHLQCAKQQASPSNLTKYCACHAKVHSKIKEKFAENSWSVNSKAGTIRTWSEHDPNMNSSSRTRPFAEVTFRASETHFVKKITTFRAPAIYPDFTCACHEKWQSDITKYCACHEKWHSWLMSVTYETSFTMRGARSITLQPHQILRLPRKKNLIFDPRHIWNVIYNARSNKHHPPTSPNTAPATQKYTPKSKKNLPKTAEASIPMRGRFEHDPNMIRAWSEHELVISHPPVRRGYFSRFGDAFCLENYNISRSGYLLKFHRILRLPRKVTVRHHQILRLPRKVTLQDHQILPLPRKVTLQDHRMLRLPRKVRLLLNCYWTELLLSCYWAVTKLLLSCYWAVTELLLNWAVTELSCYSTVTGLLLNCYWTVTELNCYWTVTELLLNWPVTELLLSCYWPVTELSCYWTVTELLLNWTVTGLSLNCYWTDLLLSCYWPVILSCYWTDLLLSCYWTVTELSCYWTELLLNCYWTVTELLLNWTVTGLLLNCYWTDLLLDCYWTVTFTALLLELLLYWTLCIFKSP